jgi:glutamine synthetase
MDGTSNPYLFAGAVLLAGLQGLGQKLPLVWKDCDVFPNSLDDGQRGQYQLEKRMPSSLQEALGSLNADDSVKKWMPRAMLKSYIAVKEHDAEAFQQMTEYQRRLGFLEFFYRQSWETLLTRFQRG